MLSERSIRRELREYGFWQNYGTKDAQFHTMKRPEITPAWMNRRTGEPHEHNRARARHCRQQGYAFWPFIFKNYRAVHPRA